MRNYAVLYLVPTEDTLGACLFGWLLIGKKLFESAKIKCFFRFSIAKFFLKEKLLEFFLYRVQVCL
jgi:hypothetical protein